MKLVMAVIKPFKLDDVRNALTGTGIHGLTRSNPPMNGVPDRLRGRVGRES
jgi:nitrogen regulatory protein PII